MTDYRIALSFRRDAVDVMSALQGGSDHPEIEAMYDLLGSLQDAGLIQDHYLGELRGSADDRLVLIWTIRA